MKIKITALVICSVALGLLLAATNPNGAKLPLYLLIFSLVYVISSLLLLLFLDLAYSGLHSVEKRFIAIVLGFSPTILLALASLSTLSVIDVLLATGIPFIIVWYGIRRGVIK